MSFEIILMGMQKIIKLFYFTVSTIPDPEFVDEIGNITVPAGRSVKLGCTVKDLGTYKVSFIQIL